MREILGVVEVFLGVFEKTKERKDRVEPKKIREGLNREVQTVN